MSEDVAWERYADIIDTPTRMKCRMHRKKFGLKPLFDGTKEKEWDDWEWCGQYKDRKCREGCPLKDEAVLFAKSEGKIWDQCAVEAQQEILRKEHEKIE